MSIIVWIPVAILLFAIIYVIYAYNKGIGLKNYVREAFATMDVYLKKRWELIPRLVDTVKGGSSYESATLEKLARIRGQSYSGMNERQKLQENATLGYIGPGIVAIAEQYPDLKANANYLKLMDGLTEIENEIARSRKYYNGTVRELNTYLELFPTNIIGRICGMEKADYFQIDDGDREAVHIDTGN